MAGHASDASSSAVRVGAVNAISRLLEVPQSHAVLRELLPLVGNLIHDRVEKVRLAVVNMLLFIKGIPKIKYYKVVPLNHLTARFAEEGRKNPRSSVASALTSLMVNSYFPQGPNVDQTEQIRRAIRFLADDPSSAVVFYSNVARYRSVESVGQLAVQLFRFFHSLVQELVVLDAKDTQLATGKRPRRSGSNAGNENNEVDSTADDSGSDIPPLNVLASIAETIATLWQSIDAKVQGQDEWNRFLADEFSGSKLTEILSYFDRKAQQTDTKSNAGARLEPNADVDGAIREDCFRISHSMLRCASFLPLKAVEELVPHILLTLSSFESRANSDTSEVKYLTGYASFLCVLNLTDALSSSLALSIQSDLPGRVAMASSPIFESQKRNSGRRSITTTAFANASFAVPQLPAMVALGVLNDILHDSSNPTCAAARIAIMSSPHARETIEECLADGMRHAERILDYGNRSVSLVRRRMMFIFLFPPSYKPFCCFYQFLEDSDANYVLHVCEAFGRFVLHREAFTNEKLSFSDGARDLLLWTTETVIPALIRCSHPSPTAVADPFTDSNLSPIFDERSFETSSPMPTQRPRRRVNHSKTPERIDESGPSSFVDRSLSSAVSIDRTHSSKIQTALANSLTISSCVLFTEWLAVGGSGGNCIAKDATDKWTEIFSETVAVDAQIIFPFCRLACQLVKSEGNFSLFRQLLEKVVESGSVQNSIIYNATTSLLISRIPVCKADIIGQVVQCVTEAAISLLENDTSVLVFALPDLFSDVWDHKHGCIAHALKAVLGNREASIAMAQQLVDVLMSNKGSATRASLFAVKCLWILCDQEGGTKVGNEAFSMIHQLDTTRMDDDIGKMISTLIELCTSWYLV